LRPVDQQLLRRYADADDHVDAADGGARGRLRQAGDFDILSRNVEGRSVSSKKK
jgi:hypothetical protein